MSKALICINTIAPSSSVVENFRNINGVSEVPSSKRMYDIVALVEANSMNELREAVLPDIRRLDNIKSTLTLTILES